MLNIFKFITIYFLFLLSSLIVVKTAKANYTFSDDFTNTLNSNWISIHNHPTPVISNGKLEFNSISQSVVFPYIAHQNIEPIKYASFDFSYEIKGSDFGSGIIFTENIPTSEIQPPNDFGDYVLGLYVLPNGKYYLFSPLCEYYTNCGLQIHPYAVYEFTPNVNYSLKFEFSVSSLDITVNNILIRSLRMNDYRADGVFFGNSMRTSSPKTWQHFWIDNLSILYSDYSVSTPAFPYLSQKDPLWGDKEYDSATQWAGIEKSGIGRWGCALTSAAMILQKNDVKTISDNTDVNPDNLNTWLKSQPDGYIGPGLVNWIALTRYAKESFEAGHANTKLEFVRSYLPDTPILPAILGIPGHFVVAYEEDTTTWTINDPANISNNSLPKTSTVKSVNRFVPSNTDLSYMMFVTKPGLSTTMTDPLDTPIGLDWQDEYITDDLEGTASPSVKVAMIPKPTDGTYILRVQNMVSDPMTIDTYLYDVNGDVSQDKLTIPPQTTASFAINYSSTSNTNSLIALDYTEIFEYIKSLRQPKTKANGIFQAVFSKFSDLVNEFTTAADVSKFVVLQSPKNISPIVKTRLQNYIMLIEEN